MNIEAHKDKLGGDAIERLLLVTALEEALKGQPLTIARSETEQTSSEKHKDFLVALDRTVGGANVVEQFGDKPEQVLLDAVAQLRTDKARLQDKCATLLTGWRLPKPGDKVRLIRLPQDIGFCPASFEMGLGAQYEVYSLSTVVPLPGTADTTGDWYTVNAHYALNILTSNNTKEMPIWTVLPLECFEPISEP